jgi:N6-adenosine-specific RNA methylase IME4
MVKIPPTITWETPDPIIYGTPLSYIELNSTINATKYSVSYNFQIEDILNAGIQTLTVTYNVAASDPKYTKGTYTKSVNLLVNKESLKITANDLTIAYGDPIKDSNLNYFSDGLISKDNITNVYYKFSSQIKDVGKYSIIPYHILGTGIENYNINYVNGILNVEKRNSNIIINNLDIEYGNIPKFTYSFSESIDDDNFDYKNIQPFITNCSISKSRPIFAEYIIQGNIDNNYNNYYINIINGTLKIKNFKKMKKIYSNKINDQLIIPKVFYDDVIERNTNELIEKIKYNQLISLDVIKFYNEVLMEAFYNIKNNNKISPYRVSWKNINDENILLYPIEQKELYEYIINTFLISDNIISNFSYLINTINNNLIRSLKKMTKILSNKINDELVIPKIFYDDVIERNTDGLIEKIKYNQLISIDVIKFYNEVLMEAFYNIKNNNKISAYRVSWKNINDENIVLYPIEQKELYEYIINTFLISGNIISNFSYLINTINNNLIRSLKKMTKILSNKINDELVIPKIFYDDVIKRNKVRLIEKIKYNPRLSTAVIKFYNLVLMETYVYKKNSKEATPYRVTWKNINDENILLYTVEQKELYKFIVQTFLPNGTIISNFGYLVNTINNYLVSLRLAMVRINNKLSAQFYFPLGVNVKNDVQMKLFIKQFI